LQRTAASPDFFAYPRAVVAVDRESGLAGSLRLKDRLYLGYQEKSGIVEVISYNEVAGRFEFQLVEDYHAGSRPRIVYAQRAVCMACHQNQAPLFSRQQWDETNANPRVADRLAKTGRSFYGFPVRIGVSEPNAVDDAIHRANEFALTRLLWRDGCGDKTAEAARCRAVMLSAATQHRLSGARAHDERVPEFVEAVHVLARNFAARWPRGLAVPNPEIPNRDPLNGTTGAQGVQLTHVPASLEPLALRPPLEVIAGNGLTLARRLVNGLSEFLSAADLAQLESELSTQHVHARRHVYRGVCSSDSGSGRRCGGGGVVLDGLVVNGKSAEVESLVIGAQVPLRHLDLGPRQAVNRGTAMFRPHQRLPDGNALESVELTGRDGGRVAFTVTVVEDFEFFRRAASAPQDARSGSAVDRLARIAGGSELLQAPGTEFFPAPELDENSIIVRPSAEAAPFLQHCAVCHATAERFPPNFLYGDGPRVEAALRSCAPRIFARLSMGELPADAREKTPMPPESRNTRPVSHGVVSSLREAAAALMKSETVVSPELATLLAHGYEALRPCLADGAGQAKQ
jgi:mono/diheme cytochrome c family protein